VCGRVAVLSFGLMCQASSARMAQNIQPTSGRGCRNGYLKLKEQRAGFYDGPSTCAIPARRRAKLEHGLELSKNLHRLSQASAAVIPQAPDSRPAVRDQIRERMEPITRTAAWPVTRGLSGKRKSENDGPIFPHFRV
jgi:hypothetical protein